MAGVASPELERALAAGAPPHEIQTLLIAELSAPHAPTVMVLEDVHWADDATLDVITVLGRRVAGLPALLVITFRGGEVPPGHPLHVALGAAGAGASAYVELAPLSPHAVATLAGEDVGELYAVTGGNPFYVTELLAARPAAGLPPSVANAVLARAARLDDPARRLVELTSVVPNRIGTRVLDTVIPEWAAAAEEPERSQLLEVGPGHVRFRHEIARHAIRSSVPIARRRRLHAEILKALLAADADPADIVHHAEAAGDEDVVAEYAPVAARRAAALNSNREAYSHFARAAEFAARLPRADQAVLAEGAGAGRLRDRPPRRRVRGHRAKHRGVPRGRRRACRRALHADPLALPLVRRGRGCGAQDRARRDHDPGARGRVDRARTRLQRALAARDARRPSRGGDRVGRRGRSRSRPGSATSPPAPMP